MSDSIQKYLDFHKEAGGTGKLFNFKLISYQEDCLELEGEFSDVTLNPDGSVQGGLLAQIHLGLVLHLRIRPLIQDNLLDN